jgi:1-acyl-sn-glycerol-3-phosphate acyltransferase
MKYLYIIYQILVSPLLLAITILTALTTILGCWIGSGHIWGYYPGKIWSRLFCHILLIPVKVVRNKQVHKKTSYVFVANHQGAFDIFLIYGFLNHNFKWMLKKS